MLDMLNRYLLWPLARFFFEFLGDHLWVAAILALLVAGAIWKWCLPWVIGFYKLFGWQGILLATLGFVSAGIFGAGWRAHRASTLSGVPKEDPNFDLSPKAKPKKPKPKEKPKTLAPNDGDSWLKKVMNGEKYK